MIGLAGSSGVTVVGMLGLLADVCIPSSSCSPLASVRRRRSLIGRKINRQMYEFWLVEHTEGRPRAATTSRTLLTETGDGAQRGPRVRPRAPTSSVATSGS